MLESQVAVVGGGVVGLSIAWQAADRGLSVALLDPRPGTGASWAAAGMLAPVTEVTFGEEALLALNLASSKLYEGFVDALAGATSMDPGYRRCGSLLVARDSDDNAELAELYEFQRKLGLSVQRLKAGECREVEPGLAPGVRGGILVEGDHQVDNRALLRALQVACERSGVTFVRDRAVSLEAPAGRVSGVRTERSGVLGCEQVVLAAGSRSSSIGGLAPGSVPVRPVKGQLLHLKGPQDALLTQHNVRGLEVYVVTRADGRVVVGATVEERGFDEVVTAGAVHDLLRAAYELLPGIAELELTETVAGLRPATPDNAPLLGPGALPGLVLATGHYRNGVLLAPVTAYAIADYLCTGRVPESIAPFSPLRFERENAS